MTRGIAVLAVVAAWSGVVACSSPSSSASSSGSEGQSTPSCTPDVQSFCAAYCAHSTSCDTSIDEQTCSNNCSNAYAVEMPKTRCDFVSAYQSCYTSADCASVLNATASGDCVNQALASIAPSAQDQSFCSALVAGMKANGCGSPAEGDCLDATKLFSDSALSDAQACTSKACNELTACVQAALPGITLGNGGGGGDAG